MDFAYKSKVILIIFIKTNNYIILIIFIKDNIIVLLFGQIGCNTFNYVLSVLTTDGKGSEGKERLNLT